MRGHLKQQLRRLEDEELVSYIQAGKSSWQLAASLLLERHRAPLLRRCRSRVGNHPDAEDALQETFLRAFRGINRFKGEAAFRSWLYVIADNQCHTLIAQRARHQLGEHLRALIEIHEQSRHAMPRGTCESAAAVRGILTAIPERDREILALRFYGDLSIEDIARTLGVKLSAAKMRLYRAQQRFEQIYRRRCLVQAV